MDILDKARMTCDERGKDYGEPIDDFRRIAKMWDVIFYDDCNCNCSVEQVALAMMALKIARICNSEGYYHQDSVLDIIGYAYCLEKIALGKKAKEEADEEDMFS